MDKLSKSHEFNPPHDHDGKLSFVIYLKIPEELKKRIKNIKVGAVDLRYAVYVVKDLEMLASVSHFQRRDMFIFPAWLKHWVSLLNLLYEDQCRKHTRLSPLNNISKFGPEYVKDKDTTKSGPMDQDY